MMVETRDITRSRGSLRIQMFKGRSRSRTSRYILRGHGSRTKIIQGFSTGLLPRRTPIINRQSDPLPSPCHGDDREVPPSYLSIA